MLTAEQRSRLDPAAAMPAAPWQARWKGLRSANGKPTGVIVNGTPMSNAEFGRELHAAGCQFTSLPGGVTQIDPPRTARPTRAGRVTVSGRARSSRRSSRATSTGPPGDGEPHEPEPGDDSGLTRVSRILARYLADLSRRLA